MRTDVRTGQTGAPESVPGTGPWKPTGRTAGNTERDRPSGKKRASERGGGAFPKEILRVKK